MLEGFTASCLTPRTVARQAPLSVKFSRQEFWSGLPFPSPEDLPDPGMEPGSPALAGGFFTTVPPGMPKALPAAAAAKSLQSCPTLCDPVDCSLRGSSVHGIFLSITKSRSSLRLTSIESVIRPSHLLSSPSPPALNPSQHQSLFQ